MGNSDVVEVGISVNELLLVVGVGVTCCLQLGLVWPTACSWGWCDILFVVGVGVTYCL